MRHLPILPLLLVATIASAADDLTVVSRAEAERLALSFIGARPVGLELERLRASPVCDPFIVRAQDFPVAAYQAVGRHKVAMLHAVGAAIPRVVIEIEQDGFQYEPAKLVVAVRLVEYAERQIAEMAQPEETAPQR